MLRGMIFLDHRNFNQSIQTMYAKYYNGSKAPVLDYNKLFRNLVAKIPDVQFTKAYIFIPKPDNELMKNPKIANSYKWASNLGKLPLVEVVKGRLVRRSKSEIDENGKQRQIFYSTEKGTDVNYAVQAITNMYFNTFEVGFFLSADTDYISVYDLIKSSGRTVIQVSMKGQYNPKFSKCVSKAIELDNDFFKTCLPDS